MKAGTPYKAWLDWAGRQTGLLKTRLLNDPNARRELAMLTHAAHDPHRDGGAVDLWLFDHEYDPHWERMLPAAETMITLMAVWQTGRKPNPASDRKPLGACLARLDDGRTLLQRIQYANTGSQLDRELHHVILRLRDANIEPDWADLMNTIHRLESSNFALRDKARADLGRSLAIGIHSDDDRSKE